jgi:hypothetical protein
MAFPQFTINHRIHLLFLKGWSRRTCRFVKIKMSLATRNSTRPLKPSSCPPCADSFLFIVEDPKCLHVSQFPRQLSVREISCVANSETAFSFSPTSAPDYANRSPSGILRLSSRDIMSRSGQQKSGKSILSLTKCKVNWT